MHHSTGDRVCRGDNLDQVYWEVGKVWFPDILNTEKKSQWSYFCWTRGGSLEVLLPGTISLNAEAHCAWSLGWGTLTMGQLVGMLLVKLYHKVRFQDVPLDGI